MDKIIHLLGREYSDISQPFTESDKFYSNERLNGEVDIIEDCIYKHCVFTDISFKEVVFDHGEFLNCIFINCYFRLAHFKHIEYVGCDFVDCNFNRISVFQCNFKYSTFTDCYIPFTEIKGSLPDEHNLREDLTRSLAQATAELGRASEARQFRLARVRAQENHLWEAFNWRSEWYQEHYPGLDRLRAFRDWLLSKINDLVWGYGEKASRLLLNFVLLTFLFSSIYYFLIPDITEYYNTDGIFWGSVLYSVETITPGVGPPSFVIDSTAVRLLTISQSLAGVLIAALLATYVFRWTSRS